VGVSKYSHTAMAGGALQRKTGDWYTQSVFECPAKLGRALAANSVRPSCQPRIARFQIAKEKT